MTLKRNVDAAGGVEWPEELGYPDPTSLAMAPLMYVGKDNDWIRAARAHQASVAAAVLADLVPEATRTLFDRLRSVYRYALFDYGLYTVAADNSWLVLEHALGERFVSFYEHQIPLIRPGSGERFALTATRFQVVYEFVQKCRHATDRSDPWRLVLQTTGATFRLPTSMAGLFKWAREEGLLHGRRNEHLEAIYRRLRVSSAHPQMHTVSPGQAASDLTTVAEIVNRLWGATGPDSRLFAPVSREVLVLGWSTSDDHLCSLMRAEGFARGIPSASPAGQCDTYVVVRGTYDDTFWGYDSRWESTAYPAELLFGPTTEESTRSWLLSNQPQPDSVEFLDRLFALRFHDGRVSLPRRPEVALGLQPSSQVGTWWLVKADRPLDAFSHVRHTGHGHPCQPGGPDGCSVAEVFTGTFESLTNTLGTLGITTAAIPDIAYVPDQGWRAPDVEQPE